MHHNVREFTVLESNYRCERYLVWVNGAANNRLPAQVVHRHRLLLRSMEGVFFSMGTSTARLKDPIRRSGSPVKITQDHTCDKLHERQSLSSLLQPPSCCQLQSIEFCKRDTRQIVAKPSEKDDAFPMGESVSVTAPGIFPPD